MRPLAPVLAVIVVLGLCFVASADDAESAESGKTGVVLLHGQNGSPDSRIFEPLAEAFQDNDILFSLPEIPWPKGRFLDRDIDGAVAEIDHAVQALRNKGASRVVIAGHSIGANFALYYATKREGLLGVMAIAAGHPVELRGYQRRMKFDYRRARELVTAGKGDEAYSFNDINQGRTDTFSVKAKFYLSYYDAEGALVMPRNVGALKSGMPLLWIIGDGDWMYRRGESYAYSNAPPHPKNKYAVVDGGQIDVLETGVDVIVGWVKGL
jgi:pimeloyl-ACP methyl ester carboxylesterase